MALPRQWNFSRQLHISDELPISPNGSTERSEGLGLCWALLSLAGPTFYVPSSSGLKRYYDQPRCSMRYAHLPIAVLLLLTPFASWGEEVGADPVTEPVVEAAVEGEADSGEVELAPLGEIGHVVVGDSIATIELSDDYQYLQAEKARFMVEKVWGNPPDPSVIGLVLPRMMSEENSWGIVVSYETEDGHIDDSDARSLEYDDIMKQLQDGMSEANAARKAQGYPTIALNGWAEPPHYDSESKKIYWAKDITFENTEGGNDRVVNYAVRILGARGVLELNAVDSLANLAKVSVAAKEVLGVTAFTDGNRYEDFKEGVDKKAAYGIAGLVAGGLVAKKFGLFVILAKFGKLLIIPLIAVFGVIGKLFGRNKKSADTKSVLPDR
jgi:uncharacterized membrane-anchored protein